MANSDRRVLVLNQFAIPRQQGGGTRHVDLFSRLESWTPKIVAGNRNHYSQEQIANNHVQFDLVGLPSHHDDRASRVIGWISYSLQALAKGLREDPDVVFASSPHLLTPLAGLALARVKRVPLVLEVRDLWPESIVSAGLISERGAVHRILSRLENRLYDSADAIVGVTEGWNDYFRNRGLGHKFTVIPNGADLSDFEVTEDRAALRDHYGFTRTTAVFAGAHGPKDGLEYILKAAGQVNDVDLVLVGAGPSKPSVMRQAVDDGLTNVRFLAPVSKEELPKLLRAADIGIHSITPLPVFQRGMSPNKFFDYLAAGLPIASNARGALTAIAGDAEVGIFGEAGDLGNCIREIADADLATKERWRVASRVLIEDKYSRTLASRRLEALLTAVAEKAPKERVAHVTTVHSPGDGRIFHKECRALAAAGFDTHLVAPHGGIPGDSGVTIHGVDVGRSRLDRFLLGQPAVWRTLKRIRPSVVHVHDPELIPLAILWKKLTGTSIVYDAHENLAGQVDGKEYIAKPLVRAAKRIATLLISLADNQFDAIVAATPGIADLFSRPDVIVVRNFPWLSDFPCPAQPEDFSKRQGAVYVGAVTKHRMVDTMIEVAERIPGCALRIAGPADAYSEDLLARASANGSIHYLGRVPPQDVPGILSTSRVGLIMLAPLANYKESLPTKMFEYMAAGVPFIASDFPYLREMLGGHDCGVFVAADDVLQVEQQLHRLLEDPEECARLGKNGRSAFEEFFSFDQDAERLAVFVGNLARARTPRSVRTPRRVRTFWARHSE